MVSHQGLDVTPEVSTDYRAACGKSFEAKRGGEDEMELVSAHFRLYGSLCSIQPLHEAAFLSMLSFSFYFGN